MARRVLTATAIAMALLLSACTGDDPSGDPQPSGSPAPVAPAVAADFCDRELFAPVFAFDAAPSTPTGSIDDKTTATPPSYTASCTAVLAAGSGRVYLQIVWTPGNSLAGTEAAVEERKNLGATVEHPAGQWEYTALVSARTGAELAVDLLVYDRGLNLYLGVASSDSGATVAELGDALAEVARLADAKVTR